MHHHDEHDDERESRLGPNDPAHTTSREAAEQVRSGEPPPPTEGGTRPGVAVSIGAAAGAAAAGAAVGTILLGPVGTVIGIVGGALGGWWVGQGVKRASDEITPELEDRYRRHFESSATAPADRSYESVRHAYILGHLARRNPEYQGKSFADVEPELSRAWTQDLWDRYGNWAGLRGYVRAAYEREDPLASDSEAVRRDRIDELRDPAPPEA